MPIPAARWCRCSRSAFPAAARPRSCSRRWCCGACKPGPLMMQESPDVFWGLVGSMYIGNVDAAGPQPAAGAAVRADPAAAGLSCCSRCILGISMVGAYGASGRMFDLGLLVGFGLLGYAMGKLKYPTRAADPRLRARRHHGAGLAPVAHDVAGRSADLGGAADLGDHAGAGALILLLAAVRPVQPARVQAITENG